MKKYGIGQLVSDVMKDLISTSTYFVQTLVDTQTYKHIFRKEYLAQFSGMLKNSCSKFQENRSVSSNMIGFGYLTTLCH